MYSTLLLTCNYQPIKPVNWMKAITLYYSGKASIVSSYDKEVRSPTTMLKMPAVVRLTTYFKPKYYQPRFTKSAVAIRDKYQCQYCGKALAGAEMTLDHVLPRSRGGMSVWDNVVLSCQTDNLKKGAKTPKEAGLKLLKKPVMPAWRAGVCYIHTNYPPEWAEWLIMQE